MNASLRRTMSGLCRVGLGTLILGLAACATVVEGTSDLVTVATTPPGATCTVDQNAQRVGAIAVTPSSLKLGKSSRDLTIACTREGYQPVNTTVAAGFTGSTIGNIFAGCVIGLAVDAASGANYRYPADVRLFMTPVNAGTPPVVLCPSGVTVRRSSGRSIRYLGADASAPDLCIVETDGQRSLLYLGLVATDEAGAQDLRNGLLKTLEGAPGTTAEYRIYETNNVWQDKFTTVGEEEVDVTSTRVRAVRITRSREGRTGPGAGYRATTTYWIDRSNGMLIMMDHGHQAGTPIDVQPFRLVSRSDGMT